MSSAQVMPSPPALPRRTSAYNTRLHVRPEEPPIPPRLIGSPLLDKLISTPVKQSTNKSAAGLWLDGDEFSVNKNGTPAAPPTSPSAAKKTSPTKQRCAIPRHGMMNMELKAYRYSTRPVAT